MAKIPSADQIQARINQAELYFSSYIQSLKRKREYFNLTYGVVLPDTIPLVRSITPATKREKMANQINADAPIFTINMPHNYNEKEEIRADREKITATLLFELSEKYSKIAPFRDAVLNLTGYGAYILRLHWFMDMHKEQEFPARITSINPENFLPISNIETCEMYQMRVMDIEAIIDEYNGVGNRDVAYWKKGSRKDDEYIKVYKYYLPESRSIIVENESIFIDKAGSAIRGMQKNFMGFNPHRYGVSGWAGNSADGLPEEEAKGINDNCFGVYQNESFMLSMVTAKVAKDIIAPYKQRKGANVAWPELPWDNVEVENMEDIEQLEQRNIDPEAYRLHELQRRQVDESTFHGGITGQRQGVSGVQDMALIGQDLKTIRHPRASLESSIEDIWEKFFKLADKYGVYYGSRQLLRKHDVVKPITIHCSLTPVDPIQKQAEQLMLMQTKMNGLISWENWALKSGLVDDLTTERKLILVNKFLAHPGIEEMMSAQVAKEWAIEERTQLYKQMAQEKGKQIPEFAGILGRAQVEAQANNLQNDAGLGNGLATGLLEGGPQTEGVV